MTGMTTYAPALRQIDDLILALTDLKDTKDPVERARKARVLTDVSRSWISRAGDEAVSLACRTPKPEDPTQHVGQAYVAELLGVVQPTVNKACTRYRAWLKVQLSSS